MSGSSRDKKGRRPQQRGPRGSRARKQPTGRSSRARAPKGSERSAEPRRDTRDRSPRRDLKGAARDLPRWIVEALTRVTPDQRVGPALDALGEASVALSEGRFHPAVRYARIAKDLAPRDATIREVLGLGSYRVGDWGTALRELRTYRRLAGESTHMPVEMDCLRAMGRNADVEEVWLQVQSLRDLPAVTKEARVVFASFLLDEGRTTEARKVATPKSLSNRPQPEDLRLWYVASRSAAIDGDNAEAVRFRDALLIMDPGFPGMDELDSAIASHAKGD